MTLNNLFKHCLMLSVLLFLASCTNNNSTASDGNTSQVKEVEMTQSKTEIQKTEASETETEAEAEAEPEAEIQETETEATKTITAKFVEFSLGDASHYVFEDESGLMWDFGGCESEDFIFDADLDESESNSSNQGFGSNKELQGKWFVLSYVQREEPLYIEGPIGLVNIITEAKLK